uniref:Uncharacterized protein n=1 Tax=Musa acuminata subsp. malaccensis TaxID=214687 RepID=A0A804I6I0_MUSAM|nr:PREDICTED: uncharacterized protein LOC103976657 [Musa acuminata subsp. malaccensis]XP_009390220.1 PREDICTED: uncharacterized protein LOC103976657 [Musa acuminata subsp. malaccensis]
MNRCAMQQNPFAAYEEMRTAFAAAERKPPVFCPKPRRLSPPAGVADPIWPLRWHSSRQADFSDSNAVADLLDILLAKDGEEQNREASSPPFFCGSPPDRAANPVVHDARFGEDRPPLAPFAPVQPTQSVTPMSPKHAKFGLLPAAVRVEGFDCLDRGCSSIAAVA